MERVISFREYLQREIPIINRGMIQKFPVSALINMVIPLLHDQHRTDLLEQLNLKIKSLEDKVNQKLTTIEQWVQSDRSFIKINVLNHQNKLIPKKVYKKQITDEIIQLNNWIFREIVNKLAFGEGIDYSRIRGNLP